jgi:hypothetical protein
MTELRGGLRLAEKARPYVVIERELRRQRLDCDMTVQAQIESAKHSRHATAANFGLDEILVANRGDDAVVQVVGH